MDLPFTELTHLDSESFLPRAPSWMINGALQPRGMPRVINPAGSGDYIFILCENKWFNNRQLGLYAAPHLDKTQGIERPELNRYSRIADDVTGVHIQQIIHSVSL